MSRPPEELYNSVADPYELNNLINVGEHKARVRLLSVELDRWMKEQGDPGIAVDTHKSIEAARKGKHLYGPSGN